MYIGFRDADLSSNSHRGGVLITSYKGRCNSHAVQSKNCCGCGRLNCISKRKHTSVGVINGGVDLRGPRRWCFPARGCRGADGRRIVTVCRHSDALGHEI